MPESGLYFCLDNYNIIMDFYNRLSFDWEFDLLMSQVVLLNVYDVMIKAVMVVPRVETKLYSEWVSF